MQASRLVAAGLAAAAIAGCGDDDGGAGGGDAPKPAAVRCTPAPAGTRELAIEPKFRADDRRTVTIEKSREDSRRVEPLRATGEAKLRVLEGGPRKAVLRWETDAISLPIPENVEASDVERIKAVTEDIAIEYATDSAGQLATLRNIAELKRATGRVLDEMEKLDVKLAAAVDALRPLLQSDQTLQATMTGDAALLHGAYGMRLEEGRPLDTPYELPNPFGGEPIPAEATFELKEIRDVSGCAVVELRVDPDVEAVEGILRELAERAGGPPPSESDLRGYRLSSATRFIYDPGSGWIVRSEATRDISIKGISRKDRTVLTSAG